MEAALAEMPLVADTKRRSGAKDKTPRVSTTVDGGYPSHEAIDEAAAVGVTVYAPLPKPRQDDASSTHKPKAGDSEAVAAWRTRMGTDEAKQIYKQRGAAAELVNADGKAHRGRGQTALCGLDKVKGGALLVALTYNILRWVSLSTG